MEGSKKGFSAKFAAKQVARKASADRALRETPKNERVWNQTDDQYSNLENASNLEFAWQFLRRNKKYQEAYKDSSLVGPEKSKAALASFGIKEFISPHQSELDYSDYHLLSVRPGMKEAGKQGTKKTLIFDLQLNTEVQIENARYLLHHMRGRPLYERADIIDSEFSRSDADRMDALKKLHLLRVLDAGEFFSQKVIIKYLSDSYERAYGSVTDNGEPRSGRKGRIAAKEFDVAKLAQQLREARDLSEVGYQDLILKWTRDEGRFFNSVDLMHNNWNRERIIEENNADWSR